MSLIERYIFRRTAAAAALTLASLVLILLTTQILNQVNLLIESRQALVTVLRLAATMTPQLIVTLLPFALLVAASRVFNDMNADSELVVVEAIGGSRVQSGRPVLALAALSSIVVLAFSLVIEPMANRTTQQIISNAGLELVRLAVRTGSFRRIEDNLFIRVEEELQGGELGGLLIADMRGSDVETITYARRGSVIDIAGLSFVVMADGQIQRRGKISGDVSIITFQTYAIDLAGFAPRAQPGALRPRERSTAELIAARAIPTPEQRLTIGVELHRRFSDWLYPFAFAAIAVFFAGGARTTRSARVGAAAATVGFALLLRAAGFLAVSASGANELAALAAYAVPLGGAGLFIALLGWSTRPRKTSGATALAAAFAAIGRAAGGAALRPRGALGSNQGGRP